MSKVRKGIQKIGHEIDKHVFNGQWTKGWRQGLETAAIVTGAVLTGGAAAGALGYGATAAGGTAATAATAAGGAVAAGTTAAGVGSAALAGATSVAGTAAIAGGLAGVYGGKQSHDTYVAEREATAAKNEAERQATAERTAQLRGLKKQLVPVLKGDVYKGYANNENMSGVVLG